MERATVANTSTSRVAYSISANQKSACGSEAALTTAPTQPTTDAGIDLSIDVDDGTTTWALAVASDRLPVSADLGRSPAVYCPTRAIRGNTGCT